MFKKHTIVIGGISGGIGTALAKRLAAAGHTVAGFGRNQDSLDRLNREIRGLHLAVCDATDALALEKQVGAFNETLGSVDAYVHAIGSIFLKPAHLTPVDDWLSTLHTNLSTAFYGLRAATKIMQKQGSGRCLFFSTAAAQVGIANHEAIAAAKGGIDAMVRSAAATYANRGIRVNAIAPSLTNTPLSKPLIGSEQGLEISKKMHPLGAIAEANDVAGMAQWLLSEEAGFVTGQIFVMDGGISSIVPKPRI